MTNNKQISPRPELVEGVRVRVHHISGRTREGEIIERVEHHGRAGLRIGWGGENREFFRFREDGQVYSPIDGRDVHVEVLSSTGRSSSFEPNVASEPRETDDRWCVLCDEKIDQGVVCTNEGACNVRQVARGRDPHLARMARELGILYSEAYARLQKGDEHVLQARQLAKMANFGDAYTNTGFRVRGMVQSDAAYQAQTALQRGTELHTEIEREIERYFASARRSVRLHRDEVSKKERSSFRAAYQALGSPAAFTHDEVTIAVPSLRASCCASECGRGDVEPAEHLPSCPVAPVEGLHGGMRSTPVSAVPQFTWLGALDCWTLRTPRGFDIRVNAVECPLGQPILGHAKAAARDAILLDFYLPPAPEAEPDRRLPVDDDPDLQAVADAASRWPGGWK